MPFPGEAIVQEYVGVSSLAPYHIQVCFSDFMPGWTDILVRCGAPTWLFDFASLIFASVMPCLQLLFLSTLYPLSIDMDTDCKEVALFMVVCLAAGHSMAERQFTPVGAVYLLVRDGEPEPAAGPQLPQHRLRHRLRQHHGRPHHR